ncbi:hypothetical protein Pla110_41950 [Polystyrenella longa]|uniref:Lactonase, 7-bladed beta-propeller n=1 Tax=Polystyrenella longa TaxID=2528007 RepID=A0A518CT83_9PLAN|nr:hypothetical protein [Polystyrenella longa]QDU82438.1 hypothetical protein Pla110_41950 [Polystyrenella longa]
MRYNLITLSLSVSVTLSLLAGCTEAESYQEYQLVQAEQEETSQVVCRLFFQDHDSSQLKWADLRESSSFLLSEPAPVKGLPELDNTRQKLVQMERIGDKVITGVRDDQDGGFQSGWIFLETGVEEEAHGDHSHWSYESEPQLLHSQVDDQQGNPAHLYQYDARFYLANDRNNGFTRIDPALWIESEPTKNISAFHAGGGNHITLAVANNSVGYSTWIDGGGPNKGRVDVVPVSDSGTKDVSYSFNLSSGAIHGATVVENKVFFAPSEGISWVSVDPNPEQPKLIEEIKINSIEIGTDQETKKPMRTGAFTVNRDRVLFVSGSGRSTLLGIINATSDNPSLTKIDIPMDVNTTPTTPQVVNSVSGQRLAFIFHDNKGEEQADEFMTIVELDPNQDFDYSDATVLSSIKVGPSAVDGHYGHHDIAFDNSGRYALWSNPGNGSITLFSLKTLEPISDFTVGGKPTKLIVHGEMNSSH